MFVNVEEVSAHEIFYYNGEAIPLKWNDVTNGTLNIKVNTDYIWGNMLRYYEAGLYAWPETVGNISITEESISNSTLDIAVAANSYYTPQTHDINDFNAKY